MTTAPPEPDTQMLGPVPPHSIDAERAVLGAMLHSADAIEDSIEILKGPGDFYRHDHQTIYQVIVDMYEAGHAVDPITVSDELARRGDLAKVGGPAALFALTSLQTLTSMAQHHAGIVRELAAERAFLAVCVQGVQDVTNRQKSAGEMAADARSLLDSIENEALDSDEDTSVGGRMADWLDRVEYRQKHGSPKGVRTGFTDFDTLTGGLQPGHVTIIAARPGMGKSTLALDFARTAAVRDERPVAFFSLEMSADDVMDRLMSAEARISLPHITRKDGMTDQDWARYAKQHPRIAAAPLHIIDDFGLTMGKIRAHCRRIQRRHGGLGLIVVDYLQLMESENPRRVENRQQEVSTISRGLKKLAGELQVPVVALSQLNRGPEQRLDKRPLLADLRESGSLEQDASIVILLHREDAYDKESPRAGEADLIVAKHRGGPTTTITVAFQGHYSRFVDMAQG